MPCSNAPSKPSHPKSKPCTAPGTNTTKPEQPKSSRSQQASSSKPPCHTWKQHSGNRLPRRNSVRSPKPPAADPPKSPPPVLSRKERSNEEPTHTQIPAEPDHHREHAGRNRTGTDSSSQRRVHARQPEPHQRRMARNRRHHHFRDGVPEPRPDP